MYAYHVGDDEAVRLAPASQVKAPDLSECELIPIDMAVVSRCGVISCIAESGGEAQLPSSVTMSDFKIWNTCSSLEPIDCKGFTLKTLSVVMKVCCLPCGTNFRLVHCFRKF